MTIPEELELREIKQRLKSRHATRADIERGRELLAAHPDLLERFERRVDDFKSSRRSADTTAAERKARQRERDRAFEIRLDLINWEMREKFRYDLAGFGWYYCRNLLEHEPSEIMLRTLIRPIQNAILFGGMNCVQFPRGVGKTTWMKIAMIWAVFYGHKHFVMTIAATRDHAKSINDQVLLTIEGSDMLRRDFPALAVPIAELAGNWRKASTQKHNGRPTGVENSGGYIVLPKIYKEDSDELVEVACGSVFYTAGIRGAIRGIAREKLRPDIIFFDDPQTRADAESASQSDKLERLIEGDAMGNFGHGDVRSCIMAITPIRPGDIAARFSNRRRHATWMSSKQPYIINKSKLFDSLFEEYRRCYAEDVAAQKAVQDAGGTVDQDTAWKLSTEFYISHQADFAGTEVVDCQNYGHLEVDAVHHILNVRATYSDQLLFEAELQMDVVGLGGGEALDPDEVLTRLNGVPRHVLPPGTFDAVAFIDVNTQAGAGIRYGVVAFGPNRLAAVIDHGKFPSDGTALVPKNTDPSRRKELIRDGIVEVVKRILTAPIRHANGARVLPIACGIDAGYSPEAVHEAIALVQARIPLHGMGVFATLGRAWNQFKIFKSSEEREIVTKDHIYSGVSLSRYMGKVVTRSYIGIHSDYWREIAQKAFWSKPLAAGSVSLFGNDESVHREFANEVCYEKLVRTYREQVRPYRMAWEWVNENPGHNHSMDLLYGCFAIACWKDVYRAKTIASVTPMVRQAASARVDLIDAEEAREIEQSRASSRASTAHRTIRKRFTTRFVKR